MQKTIVMCLCVMLLASVSSADIRYHGSGDWMWVEGVGQVQGWQGGAVPGSGTTIQTNWGGNTVSVNGVVPDTLNAKIGTNEPGGIEINAGGSLKFWAGPTLDTSITEASGVRGIRMTVL